jgi:hypothetical protein
MILGLLLACSDKDPASDDTSEPVDTAEDWGAPDGGVIELTTQDGVTLVADYYPSDAEGGSAVVLLHMIPPNWDRTSWPQDFIGQLSDQGWSVLVPDRRGAGDSGGTANEAYSGDQGKYDAAACVERLVIDGYGDIAILGASNGTTTALDYTLWSQSADVDLPTPVALGFMTGGSYTENQNSMSDLGILPAIFTYSTEESAWSVTQQTLGHDEWEFNEYAGGSHGTQMFNSKPEVKDDLVAFLSQHL